jgi:integrase
MLEAGANIRLVQELLGHKDVSTTEIYTHVMDKNFRRIESPIERLTGGDEIKRCRAEMCDG